MKHFLTLKDITADELAFLIDKGIEIKQSSEAFAQSLARKTLLMVFAKPSLRTRVSFEVGMTQLGGHAIYYDVSTSPMGKKENIADTARTASRMVDIVMASLFEHSDIEEFANNSSVPVINALTNFSHPCQILADLMTIKEKRGALAGLKLAYLGDGNNNVAHSLMYGGAMSGMRIFIASPDDKRYAPKSQVVAEARELAKQNSAEIVLTTSPEEAVENADVIYTDSWMSYHIGEDERLERMRVFVPYRVTQQFMQLANADAVFMHCLPAQRGVEVSAEVIDGEHSIVFDEAENRLHAQKALILFLLGIIKP